MAGTDRDFVIGWVSPIGVELDSAGDIPSPIKVVKDFFTQRSAVTKTVSVVEAIRHLKPSIQQPLADGAQEVLNHFDSQDYHKKTRARQVAGNLIRQSTGDGAILAKHCLMEIGTFRDSHSNQLRVIQIRSLKHPEEAKLLRTVYGESFFLIGVHDYYLNRKEALKTKCGDKEDDATDLINHDNFEQDSSGQNTRDLFELCDAFISKRLDWKGDLERILKLCTSYLNEVPRIEEFGMQVAYNASFRSGDLARQVGAAIFDQGGRVITVGRNDAPKPMGGVYQVGEENEVSDYKLRFDPSQKFRQALIEQVTVKVVDALKCADSIKKAEIDCETTLRPIIEDAVSSSPIKDIVEFGRSVHAEMDAISSAAFKGVSLAGSSLYTTTFPCHTCARHIIASGIRKIVYVQPYPKSQALKLHADALKSDYLDIPVLKDVDGEPVAGPPEKVVVEPLVGIAPRRYHSLFATTTYSGDRTERKDGQKAIDKPISDEVIFRFPFDTNAIVQIEAPLIKQYQEVFPKPQEKI